jgi:uncharacterized protein YuzE
VKITYDEEVDAVYIKLVEGEHQCRTLQLNDDIALNIGKGEKLIGIEILDAKSVLANGNLPNIVLENIQLQNSITV